ncbi:MAG: GAF domain-containing protein [Candidatus Omnitrophica bacterium]|nr:GAF domain-containing protein [Candidatus Omnitrophota bacterium]
MDDRLKKILEAMKAIEVGNFHSVKPVEGSDELAKISRKLCELGRHFDVKLQGFQKIARITEEINQGLTLEEILNHVYDSFRTMIPYDRIGFALLEDHETIVRSKWQRSEAPDLRITAGYSARLEGSSLEKIIRTNRPRILNDLEDYLKNHPKSDSTQRIVEEGMRSSLTCPLIALGKPLGFIFFSSMKKKTYQDIHVDLFMQIAGQLAVIAEKGKLYEELVILNEQKNRFLGIVAHDLRAPLATIKGYLGILLGGLLGEIPDNQKHPLEKMTITSDKMLSLIKNLLDVSVIESGVLNLDKKTVDLTEYLNESLSFNTLIAKGRNFSLRADIGPDLPKVVIDPDKMDQVINNLVGNAIKFSKPGTAITLRARVEGQEVHISVQDEGQGIPPGEIAKLFKDFGKTIIKPTTREASTGLGLAIAKKMVEAHHGRIWVESVPGKGSTFTFSIPLEQVAEKAI